MAQPITCDVHGRAHPADVLVSQIATGETFAACADGYLDMCRAVVDAADQVEREATDAAALAVLADTEPAEPFPTSGESSGADAPPAEPPTSAADGRASGKRHRKAAPKAATPPEPNPGVVWVPDEAGAVPR